MATPRDMPPSGVGMDGNFSHETNFVHVFFGIHLTHVRLQVTRWRLYIVLDPLSMRARVFGPRTQKFLGPSVRPHHVPHGNTTKSFVGGNKEELAIVDLIVEREGIQPHQ